MKEQERRDWTWKRGVKLTNSYKLQQWPPSPRPLYRALRPSTHCPSHQFCSAPTSRSHRSECSVNCRESIWILNLYWLSPAVMPQSNTKPRSKRAKANFPVASGCTSTEHRWSIVWWLWRHLGCCFYLHLYQKYCIDFFSRSISMVAERWTERNLWLARDPLLTWIFYPLCSPAPHSQH